MPGMSGTRGSVGEWPGIGEGDRDAILSRSLSEEIELSAVEGEPGM